MILGVVTPPGYEAECEEWRSHPPPSPSASLPQPARERTFNFGETLKSRKRDSLKGMICRQDGA
jgi:hypothetical protein